MNTQYFVAESNRIEGIQRAPTPAEICEFERFIELPEVTVGDLEKFVSVYQSDACLRLSEHQNVRVGSHFPPIGGAHIKNWLIKILYGCNSGNVNSYETHIAYETLHPFTDCNGRSGRMLWYWQMNKSRASTMHLGFLHAFYYQSLDGARQGESK